MEALAGITVTFERGKFTAVMGPSGSGKSTLMHCMAGLDRPTSGQVFVGDSDIGALDDTGLTKLRRDRIGFIFQSFNLVPTLTAAENITLPIDLAGTKVDQDWFTELTEKLSLTDRLKHKPSQLSGGQQQRVACARALVTRPELIFADEPTGNLDSNASAPSRWSGLARSACSSASPCSPRPSRGRCPARSAARSRSCSGSRENSAGRTRCAARGAPRRPRPH
jgi:putative ABC transport system ATP-binding protein